MKKGKEVIAAPGQTISAQALSQLILHGNLSQLQPADKVAYYNKVCEVIGLNPLTQPFNYMTLQGKEVLYANKGCAEQLRQVHKISIRITSTQAINGVYVVIVEASDPAGRTDSATAAVPIGNLSGETLANAYMKCETKAKRRVTLSICGLNMLNEDEVETIPNAQTSAAPIVVNNPPPPAAAPKVLPKEEAPNFQQKLSRDSIAAEIVAAKNALGMDNKGLQDYVAEKIGKSDFKTLSISEMMSVRDGLKHEIGRNGKSL